MLLSAELDDALCRAEIAGARTAADAANRFDSRVGATSIEVAAGLVLFTGVGSPLSQAWGVGRQVAVSAGDVDAITDFYESRSAIARVFVTPTCHPSLQRKLARAGYVPTESENVLVSRDLAGAETDDRISVASDVGAWARASARGFLERERLEPGEDVTGLVLGTSEGSIPLQIRENGAIVATAAMDVRGECAGLFAGSTLPDFRRRGLHLALIRDRIARARRAGASLLRATAKPESASERNFRRCGFTKVYTRVLWERPR
jgi:GNAT superfamily N-acetyltransferase